MFGLIAGPVVGLVKTWIEGRNVNSKAKAEANATVMVQAAKSVPEWERLTGIGSCWKLERRGLDL